MPKIEEPLKKKAAERAFLGSSIRGLTARLASSGTECTFTLEIVLVGVEKKRPGWGAFFYACAIFPGPT